jgi:hypothetical protein
VSASLPVALDDLKDLLPWSAPGKSRSPTAGSELNFHLVNMSSEPNQSPETLNMEQQATLAAATNAAAEAATAAAYAAQAATAVAATPSGLGKALHKPSKYDGKDRNGCTTFISQLKLYINGNPHIFVNEQAKVLFASTYLEGKAFAWMEPRINKGTDPMLQNFNIFCDELLRNLGDPDREKTMSKKLRSLKQTSSAAAYRTEFDNIRQYLDWDEGALKEYFYEGLKESVKDSLVLVPIEPEDFKEYQDLCIRLDNRIFERKQDSKSSGHKTPHHTSHKDNHRRPASGNTYTRPQVQVNTFSRGTPMDLDASANRKYKPLTPQERQHRMQNQLCLYCGKPGHRAGDCPAKKGRPARLQATLTAPMDKSDKSQKSEN